jgi:hypothetical protein
MTRRALIPLLALLALAGGCGKDLVAGGYTAVGAVATDDAQGEGASAARLSRSDAGAAGAAAPQGTLEVQVAVALIDSRGDAWPVTTGSSTARLRIAASDSVVLGESRLESGSYTRVRLTFTRVRAEVTGGLSIGGVSLLGTVEVAIGAEPLVVELPLPLTLAGEPRTLVVDLNSPTWLAAASPLSRQVPAAAFRGAVEVRAR